MCRIDPKQQEDAILFTVDDFLKALYSEPHHSALNEIDNAILEERMNFLGFTSTERHPDHESGCIPAKSSQELCYTLLWRSMKLQLAPQ